jgi:hypothetical protein
MLPSIPQRFVFEVFLPGDASWWCAEARIFPAATDQRVRQEKRGVPRLAARTARRRLR